jgi:hypothetical protein
MTRLTRLCRAVGVGLAVAAATLSMTQVAHAEPEPAPPTLPTVAAKLAPPTGNKVYLVGHATGVQIYKCSSTPTGPAWTLLAPEANLVADNGDFVAKHFAGPTWQAKDGSSVVATRAADPVTVDETAIPWLLLRVTKASPGREGDRLALTTFIQRVNTTGGLAPTSGCGASTLNTETRVNYTADYFFWKATGGAR